ncbi:MAG: hypothetical protein FJ279_22065 [Planctomycetes bacterium]|nr:hypothetical protein [Planctomycetota bacterium]
MTQSEIVDALKKLTATERLTIIEAALRLTHQDLQQARAERTRRLAVAAKALLPDYSAGGELTAFTALDGEDVHA